MERVSEVRELAMAKVEREKNCMMNNAVTSG